LAESSIHEPSPILAAGIRIPEFRNTESGGTVTTVCGMFFS
jgi:hypothetical protein